MSALPLGLSVGLPLASAKLTLQRGIAVAVTLGLLVLIFELVRRKRLSERYALLWLLAAATLLALAAWKGLLTSLSHDVGISYPPSALFAVAIGLIIVILLHFSLAVSRLSDQNKMLAQRLGLLQERLDRAEGKGSAGEGGQPLQSVRPRRRRRPLIEESPEPEAVPDERAEDSSSRQGAHRSAALEQTRSR